MDAILVVVPITKLLLAVILNAPLNTGTYPPLPIVKVPFTTQLSASATVPNDPVLSTLKILKALGHVFPLLVSVRVPVFRCLIFIPPVPAIVIPEDNVTAVFVATVGAVTPTVIALVMVMVFAYPVPELKFRLAQAPATFTVQAGDRLSNIASVVAVGTAAGLIQLLAVPQLESVVPLQVGITTVL